MESGSLQDITRKGVIMRPCGNGNIFEATECEAQVEVLVASFCKKGESLTVKKNKRLNC